MTLWNNNIYFKTALYLRNIVLLKIWQNGRLAVRYSPSSLLLYFVCELNLCPLYNLPLMQLQRKKLNALFSIPHVLHFITIHVWLNAVYKPQRCMKRSCCLLPRRLSVKEAWRKASELRTINPITPSAPSSTEHDTSSAGASPLYTRLAASPLAARLPGSLFLRLFHRFESKTESARSL